MQASASGEEYQLLNLEFHRAMTAPCSNRALREAYEASLKRMQWAWNLGIVTVGEAGNSRMEHAQVMAAYRARDAEGVRRHLRAHLEAGLSRLVEPS
jgi:DNA-binding GntR family transcriptional regulator